MKDAVYTEVDKLLKRISNLYEGAENYAKRNNFTLANETLNKTSDDIDSVFKHVITDDLQNKELESLETRLNSQEKTVEDRLKMTEEDIVNYIKNDPRGDWYEWPTWKEIVKRDAAKNYNNDENYYYRQQEESERKRIESWKNLKIKSLVDNNISLRKQIEKLKAKISQML
jgi:hypothetical protein